MGLKTPKHTSYYARAREERICGPVAAETQKFPPHPVGLRTQKSVAARE